MRTAAEADLLGAHGNAARVFELQGELFVGTIERVLRELLDAVEESDLLVLDCKRVTRTDDAAVRLLAEMRTELAAAGCTLVLADAPGPPDVDAALEWCEDRILDRAGATGAVTATDLGVQELLRGLDPSELDAIRAVVRSHELPAGAVLFKHGDPADSVFFIHAGALSVMLPTGDELDGEQPGRRLARLGPGVTVGEMALAGDSVRSADVVVAEDALLTELTTAALASLGSAHPRVVARLNATLAQVLADRLRRANEHLRLLVG